MAASSDFDFATSSAKRPTTSSTFLANALPASSVGGRTQAGSFSSRCGLSSMPVTLSHSMKASPGGADRASCLPACLRSTCPLRTRNVICASGTSFGPGFFLKRAPFGQPL